MAMFAKLPTELRLIIWDFALQQEANNRHFLIVGPEDGNKRPHIMPYHHYASPFLSVNGESRYRAKAIYTTKLDVYEFFQHPYPDWCDESYLNNMGEWSKIEVFVNHAVNRRPKGVLYLSPKWDVLVSARTIDNQPGSRSRRPNWHWGCRFITVSIDIKLYTNVCRVVYSRALKAIVKLSASASKKAGGALGYPQVIDIRLRTSGKKALWVPVTEMNELFADETGYAPDEPFFNSPMHQMKQSDVEDLEQQCKQLPTKGWLSGTRWLYWKGDLVVYEP